jgi:L-alanine-DL-glutamate epimerase-like enolase superfamily enzyme
MKIKSCQTQAVSVNFEGVMPATHIVLRLQTDEGVEGISYISRMAKHALRPQAQLIEGMVELLVGSDPTDTDAIWDRLLSSAPARAPVTGMELRAASAIDVACWDIKGKALNQPIFKLMGGYRDRVPVSANWRLMPGPAPDEIEKHVASLLARGFKAMKCPVGFAPLDTAVAHVKFVRKSAGPDIKIIVDGNFRWTVKQAQTFARATEDCDLYWIEDPVPYNDYDGMRDVTASIKQNTCAGEVFQHPHEFARLLEQRCSDFVMIDQDLGLTGFLKVAHMAGIYGKPVVNHLAPETLCQPIAAVSNGLIVGLVPWGQPLFNEQMRVEDGMLVMPQAPGLGLTLNEDLLKRSAI